jgi:hypothetical protein
LVVRFSAVTGTVTVAVVPCAELGAFAASRTETQCCGVAASAWVVGTVQGKTVMAAPVHAAVGYTVTVSWAPSVPVVVGAASE